ncbi:MAG TPA: hypothetical protein VKI61_16740, partial [Chitinophagaceae bacterium]|nr:hypothetical protein [Chitinophagaceae bacterium]
KISSLEKRLLDVKISFNRQLTLIGKPGYDPKLTMSLKKDIAWLEEQNKSDATQNLSLRRAI